MVMNSRESTFAKISENKNLANTELHKHQKYYYNHVLWFAKKPEILYNTNSIIKNDIYCSDLQIPVYKDNSYNDCHGNQNDGHAQYRDKLRLVLWNSERERGKITLQWSDKQIDGTLVLR